jgi:outer membrane protein OmpA-like peptidoglycan-associated protein
VSVAGEIKNFVYAANVGFEYRNGLSGDFGGNANGSEIRFGAAAGLRLLNKNLVLGPELHGSTVVLGSSLPAAPPPLELLISSHYTTGEWRIGMGGGPGLTRGIGQPMMRVALSIEWTPKVEADATSCVNRSDRDLDNICDDVDACPDRPGIRASESWRNGCPVCTTGDPDGDGLCNEADACPTLYGLPNSERSKNGCPRCTAGDFDGDGICSDLDTCPNAFGVANPDPKKHGCPGECSMAGGDTDGDGICNRMDSCPNRIGAPNQDPSIHGCPALCLQNGGDEDGDGVCGDVDACAQDFGYDDTDPKLHGCPPPGVCVDKDNDGTCDGRDACPEEFGDPNMDPDSNGCPIGPDKRITLVIDSTVVFQFDKDKIDPTPQSEDVLHGVLRVLSAHPEYALLHVAAYTDNMGSDEYNLSLSRRRAEAVVGWLVARGVPASSLMSDGFGKARPIAPNTTEKGRAKNRRVEIHVERIDPRKRRPKPLVDTVIKTEPPPQH